MISTRALRNALLFQTIVRKDSILFLNRGELFVNSRDDRGLAVLAAAGVTQPYITLIWRELVQRLKPNLVLDIGANYGEIALSARYEPDTQIYLFEPNPYVREYLARSAAAHRNQSQLRIRSEIVSDGPGLSRFIINRKWSGTSSAIGPINDGGFERAGEQEFETIEAPTVPIDTLGFADNADHRLLFKIDVEGYEGRVLSGMRETLQRAAAFAGIIEFDQEYLARAGTNPQRLLDDLSNNGSVVALHKGRVLTDLTNVPKHFDLLVASDEGILPRTEALPVSPFAAASIRLSRMLRTRQ
jgi:FkbM family methyltransferase